MVAMTPLITIQLLGLYFRIKEARAARIDEDDDNEIIEMEASV